MGEVTLHLEARSVLVSEDRGHRILKAGPLRAPHWLSPPLSTLPAQSHTLRPLRVLKKAPVPPRTLMKNAFAHIPLTNLTFASGPNKEARRMEGKAFLLPWTREPGFAHLERGAFCAHPSPPSCVQQAQVSRAQAGVEDSCAGHRCAGASWRDCHLPYLLLTLGWPPDADLKSGFWREGSPAAGGEKEPELRGTNGDTLSQ